MKTEKKEKVLVIGGGIAGLAAGIYALRAGFDAEIFEKNAIPGGECIGWNRDGFHIDNCIHWLTGTKKGTELYEVWKTVGALSDDTEYAKIDAFYSTCHEGKCVTLWNDLERTERELIEAAPEDEEEIRHFIQSVEYSKQCLIPGAKPMEMWGIRDYLAMGKNMADFPKVMKEFGKISLAEYSRRFRSPLMQKLVCDYLPKEYTTYSLLVSYATMADGNGMIPLGASLQMTLRMEKRFRELGGVIRYQAGAERILTEGKTVTGILLENGETVTGDYVVPTVDTHLLFTKLIPGSYMPKVLKRAYAAATDYPATSGFQIAFSVPATFSKQETVFFDCEPLKVGARSFDRLSIKGYGYDPVFVKGDRQVLQACVTQTDEDYYRWKSLSSDEYKAAKEKAVEEIRMRVEKQLPEFAGNMEFLDAWTPLTYERYCNAYHGSYMSFITTPAGKPIRWNGRVKGLKNLYVAGQWTMPPGGLPIAVTSGKFAIQRILKDPKRDIAI